jgi:histidine triad (HIT) family protein
MVCAFCDIVAADDPEVLVYTSAEVVGFLDARPVFHGHVLVVPRAHVPTLADLPAATMQPLLSAVQVVMAALTEAVGAEGTFVATNNHISQSVPHLHMHVVPRRRGDGLKGFFWPRHPYPDEAARAEMAARVRAAVERIR